MKKKGLIFFYLTSFFTNLFPLCAVYLVIINKAIESEFLTSTLLAAWALTVVVLEIPSGALADWWDKKIVALIGQGARLMTCLLWFLFDSYFFFLLGFIFWGIQESFCSGALESLLYEEVERNHSKDEYEHFASRVYRFSTIALSGAIFTGAYLYKISPFPVFLISLITNLMALLFTFFLPHEKDPQPQKADYFSIIGSAVKQVCSSVVLIRLFLFSLLSLTVIGTIEEYIPVYLEGFRWKAFLYGGSLTLVYLGQTIGAYLSPGIKKITEKKLYGIGFCTSLLLGLVYFSGRFSVVLLFLVALLTAVIEVKFNVILQHSIKGARATVLSFSSLTMNAGSMVIVLGIGGIAESFSLEYSFLLSGFIGAGLIGLLILFTGRFFR